ncbi:MAG TPA: Eco57I restriction-modification methylase domain-containing protein [Bacteroidales bacterium]|nr:Eco57I restriction-modification methylase domain-containing protein [Bacteroidales bacterium]
MALSLNFLLEGNILESGIKFFKDVLDINVEPATKTEIRIREFVKDHLTDEKLLEKVNDSRFIGVINDFSIKGREQYQSTDTVFKESSGDYDMFLVFGIDLKAGIVPTKSDISRLTRALNRRSFNRPVILLTRYSEMLSFSAAERGEYKKKGQKGEKIGRISILRDIDLNNVHSGHERILLQLRINPLEVSLFKDLYNKWLDVFNISILNKEFYNELFTWYLWAVRSVSFPNKVSDVSDDKVYNSENVIRLLTRLIFIWFVKEKRLIPETLFDRNSLTGILKSFNPESGSSSDFYKAVLQNLFFATLNTEMPKDGGKREFLDESKKNKKTGYSEEYMDHLSFRYKELFVDPKQGLKLFENVPFLNGGLFECLDRRDPETNEEIRIDGFSTKAKNNPAVPNILFFGRNDDLDLSDEYEDGKRHKHSKARGIINILNSYKFTIEENTPLEQEIALDPELLGKIFENLLASFNPETKTTARKQTGSYYTPREIVNYMVDESLIAFLKTKLTEKKGAYKQLGSQQTNIFGNKYKTGQLDIQIDLAANKWNGKEDRLETKLYDLLAYEHDDNPFNDDKETTQAIIAHLSECKILDPACGSGAFPMGMLHKMVFALGKLDPCNFTWKQAQLDKALRDRQRAELFEDETLRNEAITAADEKIHYIEASFGETGHELDYTRKLFLIENCIYGVDIQQIAVQISKLRFFISLMVDQRVDDNRPNRNILSLPNLETKFVAADTLIPIEKPHQEGQMYSLIGMDSNLRKVENELHSIRQRIFFTKKWTEKKRLKIQEFDKRKELQRILISNGFPTSSAGQIASWDPFNPLHSSSFFDPEIMFAFEGNLRGFFDIVFGNPPYIQFQTIKEQAKKYDRIGYKSYNQSGDIYCLFYELGYNLLKSNGVLTLISSNRFCFTNYGFNLRGYLSKIEAIKIININNIDVFDEVNVGTLIYIGCKSLDSNKDIKILEIKDKIDFYNFFNAKKELIPVHKEFFQSDQWCFQTNEILSLKKKIGSCGTEFLKLPDLKINRGITTGANNVFIIEESRRNELIQKDPIYNEILVPILRGADIKRWIVNPPKMYIIYSYTGIDIRKYDLIYKYLAKNKEILTQVYEAKNKQKKWYELRACSYYESFSKEKLIWTRLSARNSFAISVNGEFSVDSTSFATGENLKYYCCILNSKLILFFFKLGSVIWGPEGIKWFGDYFDSLPIIPPNSNTITLFNNLYDKIVNSLSNKDEETLNLLVYKLYRINYNECKIIDPEIEELISREDYEKATIEELAEWEFKK